MKNIFYLILLSTICFSCKSNSNKSVSDLTTSAKPITSQNVIQKFKPIVQGVWVKKDYLEKVAQSRSPAASADLATGLTTVYINTAKIIGDSLVTKAGWGNHEGSDLMMYFRPGVKPNTIKLGNDDISYEIIGADTIMVIYHMDKGTEHKVKYLKALNNQPDDDLGYGINYVINKKIITGSYTSIDTAGKLLTVVFNSDGTLNGFLNQHKYVINIDLNSDPMDNLDEISFSNKSFSFKFTGDTLKLFDTKANADSTELILDKLKYKLIKQRSKH